MNEPPLVAAVTASGTNKTLATLTAAFIADPDLPPIVVPVVKLVPGPSRQPRG